MKGKREKNKMLETAYRSVHATRGSIYAYMVLAVIFACIAAYLYICGSGIGRELDITLIILFGAFVFITLRFSVMGLLVYTKGIEVEGYVISHFCKYGGDKRQRQQLKVEIIERERRYRLIYELHTSTNPYPVGSKLTFQKFSRWLYLVPEKSVPYRANEETNGVKRNEH